MRIEVVIKRTAQPEFASNTPTNTKTISFIAPRYRSRVQTGGDQILINNVGRSPLFKLIQ